MMRVRINSIILAAASYATVARAHGTVSGFVTDGTWNQGFLLDYYYLVKNGGEMPDIAAWYAEDLDNGFVAPDAYGTSDINCHINAKPGSITTTVAAGGTVQFQWTTWPHDIGPILTYVAPCDGACSDVDKTTLKWVKIDAVGWDPATSKWASGTLIENNNTWITTVPTTLAPGNYVFRHEIIALHGGATKDGAQNYPQCFNIAITGSGTDKPTGILGVDLYKEDDPGILFNPYVEFVSYPIPGPPLYSSDGDADSSTTPTTLSPTTTTIAKTKTTLATSTTTGTTTPAAGGVALYGQCGGKGWRGSTACAQGSCKILNDFYSQCL
ncbi:glycosyl hydrolase family 61-domain-containing protein [Xylaria nigripes]|nr:glycosyl hydrolase family 61-domain-containing protein [Xylaria nigripes]